MKKQLLSTVRTPYVDHEGKHLDRVIGEVWYVRRTWLLRRLVRKVIYKVEVPLDYCSVKEAKETAQRCIDTFVRQYYSVP